MESLIPEELVAPVGGQGDRDGFLHLSEFTDGVVIMGNEAVEVREMSGIGGGRGVFARRDIKVGEVVLEEVPLVRALPTHQKSEEGRVRATDEPLHMQLTRRVLQDPRRDLLLQQMEVLYPRTVDLHERIHDDMDLEVYKRAKRHHADFVDKLVDKQQATSAQPPLGEEEVLVVLLKVCFNAFQGGIYVKKGMFNHSCRPNCETFGAGERPGRNAGDSATCRKASEIVANTDIPAGTELTISYLFPIEQTHASRQRKFEKQHFCDIGPSPWPREVEALLFEDEQEFDESMRKEVLESLAQVEEALDHLDDLLESGEATHKFAFKQLKSELQEAETLVPPNHLVVCRINNMIVRSANELIASQKKPNAAIVGTILRCSLEVLDAVHGGVSGTGATYARTTAASAAPAPPAAAAAPDPWDIFGGDDSTAPPPLFSAYASTAAHPVSGGAQTSVPIKGGGLPVAKAGYAAYGAADGGAGCSGGGFKLPGALGGSGGLLLGSLRGSEGEATLLPEALVGSGANEREDIGLVVEAYTGAAVLGRDHCERARVLCDVHGSLDFMMEHAPELLYSSFGESLSSWQKVSKIEYAAKKEYKRIAALYDQHQHS